MNSTINKNKKHYKQCPSESTGRNNLLSLPLIGSSLSLLQAALLGASERRTQAKQVRPTLWDAVEEARVRRAGLKTLRLGLLGDTLTESRLSQLGKALRELQVSQVRPVGTWESIGQCPP